MQHGKESTKSATLITSIDVLYGAGTLVTACTLSLNETIFVIVLIKLAVYTRVSLESNQEIAFLRSNQYNTFHVAYNKGMQQNRILPWARTRLQTPLWTVAIRLTYLHT